MLDNYLDSRKSITRSYLCDCELVLVWEKEQKSNVFYLLALIFNKSCNRSVCFSLQSILVYSVVNDQVTKIIKSALEIRKFCKRTKVKKLRDFWSNEKIR